MPHMPHINQISPISIPTPKSPIKSLHELTEQISELLHLNTHHHHHHQGHGSDSRNHVVDPSHHDKNQVPGTSTRTTEIAVIFGKRLQRDQMTVEYGNRVVSLIRLIRAGEYKPDVICFTGGVDEGSFVSQAS
eukprot:CAMPEP_0184700388 /NCGR_PEP_ID=MMETSP0313-20130426/12884_1 /TAXON_ID=2792 /ORGANISM="Porphyridium aerugineum, Strain SAG 1380-2" /LENGTH=132 /DNA_ID=CAMNT_0027160035 /DNA_START=1 /DNA_END=395 /DNA_ORIENTATION=+